MKKRVTLLLTLVLFSAQFFLPMIGVAEGLSNSESYTNEDGNASSESTPVDANENSDNSSELTKEAAVTTYAAESSTTGITITPSYTDGTTLSGSQAIYYTVNISGATISSGESLTFTFSDPSILSTFTPNGGTAYGSWSTDISAGTATFTFSVDVVSTADIAFILNVQTKNLTTTGNVMTATLGEDIISTSTFNTTYVSPGGGGSYNGQMLFIGGGQQQPSATIPDSFTNNYISGTMFYYTPNVATMDFNIIYDAGFYNKSKSDYTNRKVTISFLSNTSGVNPTLSAENIYFSNKTGYPPTATGYVTLASLGMTTTQVNSNTVEITIPDGSDTSYSWGYFYIMGVAPSTTATYYVEAAYSSDVYTTANVVNVGNFKYQTTGSTGFIPTITASDKTVNTSETITDVTSWLLEGVTATDVEDGDISSSVTVQSDGGFAAAWAAKTPGSYTITYTVTDSDGNTVTQTSTVTIYSDILVHYVDTTGATIKEDTTLSGTSGATFTLNTSDFTVDDTQYTYVSANPTTVTGTYGTTGQLTESTLTYKWIKASDYTTYIGDSAPTITDFGASAIDASGDSSDVTVDLSSADLIVAGTYNVTITSADGQTKTVTLTVKENQQSITASDYTMYIGDAIPTASDFAASATDKQGNASAVTVDLSKADVTKAGTYTVTLTSADGQTTTAKLIVQNRPVTDGIVTIYYVDQNGEKIAETQTQTGPLGTDYTTTALEIAGYTLDEEKLPINATGTYTSGATTVTYVYNKMKTILPSDPPSSSTTKESTGKSLPNTGEQTSWLSIVSFMTIIVSGGFIANKRRKTSN